jgi:hypothetical protein
MCDQALGREIRLTLDRVVEAGTPAGGFAAARRRLAGVYLTRHRPRTAAPKAAIRAGGTFIEHFDGSEFAH